MQNLYAQAKQSLVGGVNSPVRAFKAVGGSPIFMRSAKGAYITDENGQQYIDYVNSWGANLLGHADARIISQVNLQVQKGLSFGAPCILETKCAELIKSMVPSIDKIRFVNSGTEAVMSAIRLARGYTDRTKIIKFIGNYHGHSDSLLVEAGSGALTLGVPTSAGVVDALAKETIALEYNNIQQLIDAFIKYKDQIAAVIVEPIAGNMNFVMPKPSFLDKMRELCNEHSSVLIFDEVMTGFRVAKGGAQELYNIRPDLTAFAKVIGGGMPVGAFGGNDHIMSFLAPEGPVYQAGTLSGNPVAMAAGIAVLSVIKEDKGLYNRLSELTKTLTEGMQNLAKTYDIPFYAASLGGMFGLFFLPKNYNFDVKTNNNIIDSFAKVAECNDEFNTGRFNRFFKHMLDNGVYLAPSSYEAGFISAAHTEQDILNTLEIAAEFFKVESNIESQIKSQIKSKDVVL